MKKSQRTIVPCDLFKSHFPLSSKDLLIQHFLLAFQSRNVGKSPVGSPVLNPTPLCHRQTAIVGSNLYFGFFSMIFRQHWGNSAPHKFELQAVVAPRGNKILAICFWLRNILARGLFGLLTKMAKKNYRFLSPSVKFSAKCWGYRWGHVGIFGSNVPLVLLIDP